MYIGFELGVREVRASWCARIVGGRGNFVLFYEGSCFDEVHLVVVRFQQ
jgi:hypothetical protein